MSDRTIKFGVLAGVALLLWLILIGVFGTDNPSTVVEERDIYMPTMEFETLSESDNAILQQCKDFSNRIVYELSLDASSIVVNRAKKLRTAGQIAFTECLKHYSLHVAEVE